MSTVDAGVSASTVEVVAVDTKAVVAICVVSVPKVAVGAAGVPVKVGEARGALFASTKAVLET
tara:strand:- start:2693 stop:2881 length:189 start_codon:yes stop_codon:yes gene_type:complete